MHQRGGVDHLDHRGHADQHGVRVAQHAPGKQHQDGAQALAAAGLQVLVDVVDGFDGRHRFEADFALDFLQVRAVPGRRFRAR